MRAFKSILEFQKHFNTDEKCIKFLEEQRWNGEPCCPFCGSIKVKRIKGGKRFQCNEKGCRSQFSVTVGTVCENTKIPLTKWFLAMYILSNHSKGISSLQLAGFIGCSQKTAWHLGHRVREMLSDNDPDLLEGIVEVDETVVGGRLKNKHASQRRKLSKNDNKTIVFGALQRGGNVVTKIVPDSTADSLVGAVKETIEEGSIMVSDENVAYKHLNKSYKHARVNHSKGEYVRGAAYTNTIEGFWNILKKQINGIHHSVSRKHLHRYCSEASFRYNNKRVTQDVRFADALANCDGSLKYNELTKK